MRAKNPSCGWQRRCRRRKTVKTVCWLGLTLTCLVALLLFTGTAAAFPDVPATHPYSTAIDEMAAAGVMSGFDDGTFGPDKPSIRQQFAKMIVKTLDLEVTDSEVCPFADVDVQVGNDPCYPAKYVAVCAEYNITEGKTATTFAPYENISRQQVITMVVRAADNVAPGTLEAVPDGWTGVLSYGDPDHGDNIKKAEYNGLLDGIWASDSSPGLAGWDTYGDATRGEAAQILWSLSQEMPFKGTLVGQIQVNWHGPPPPPPPSVPPTMDGVGTGSFTHLGPTQMTSSHILPRDPNQGFQGTTTLTAANGDQLFLAYSDALTDFYMEAPAGTHFASQGTFEIVGGTGRFEGAQGSGVTTAYLVYPGPGDPSSPIYPNNALFVPWDVTWTYEGTISY